MKTGRLVLTLAAAAAAVAGPGAAEAAGWMGSWAAAPAPPPASAPGRPAPSFEDQTLVQIVRLSAGGSRLRVRLSNDYGEGPLVIGAARAVLIGPDGKALPGTERELRFAGQPGVRIPSGAPMVSDPVALPTRALARVKVSLYLPTKTPDCSCHTQGREALLVSPKGDYTNRPFDAPAGEAPTFRAFLSAVEVEAAAPGRVVVAFGDSITDGNGSTLGANRRYPDVLAERLVAASGGRSVAVVNAGISGNRILADGLQPGMGRNALSRFDRDVLAVPGATHVIVLEGVNDIGVGRANPLPAADLIAGYQQMIDRAHAHGLKIIGATVLPYEGAAYYDPAGERVRQALNQWIRTPGHFDAVVDFDAAMRDPARPTRMKADLHSGDWLHPNDAGYRVMAGAFDLTALR